MRTVRKYGNAPFRVAVIHGGPGAPGSVAPLACKLSTSRGVLEPLQSADSVYRQVQELKHQLEAYADLPVSLIGWSWGAWLSFLVAAQHPGLVGKLILVSSGPFEAHYAEKINETRMSRLAASEREEATLLQRRMNDPTVENKDELFGRFGELFEKADIYDALPSDAITCYAEPMECEHDIYERVWKEAAELRKNGKLLEMGKSIRSPVVAIHGDYDPHPAEGVEKPLSTILSDFRFILLKNCGHDPWRERQARDDFFRIVREELGV